MLLSSATRLVRTSTPLMEKQRLRRLRTVAGGEVERQHGSFGFCRAPTVGRTTSLQWEED